MVDRGNNTVGQYRPRRLWDEVEQAYRQWDDAGRPARERIGLTVTRDGKVLALLLGGELVVVGSYAVFGVAELLDTTPLWLGALFDHDGVGSVLPSLAAQSPSVG